jgi:hypothetical protein
MRPFREFVYPHKTWWAEVKIDQYMSIPQRVTVEADTYFNAIKLLQAQFGPKSIFYGPFEIENDG